MTHHIPCVAYKYIHSSYAESVLSQRALRIASRTNYNDPMEMQFCWEKLTTEMVWEHVCKPALLAFIKKLNLFSSTSPENSEKRLRTVIEQIFHSVEQQRAKVFLPNENLDQNSLFTIFDQFIRVCSFMKKHDSVTMWSHYANEHQGICVKFKPRVLTKAVCQYFGLENCVEWHPVKYAKDFPSFHPIRVFMKGDNDIIISDVLPLSTDTLERFLNILTTKGKDWRSEKEIRMIISAFPEKKAVRVPGEIPASPGWAWLGQKKGEGNFIHPESSLEKDAYQQSMDVLNFPSEAVSSIYFGCKADSQFIEQIQSLCAEQYPHASLFKMKQVENKYELTAYPLP